MEEIALVTDSTCDLPPEEAARLGIEVVPLLINMGSERIVDGIDLTKNGFYRRLPEYDPAPTTAAPGAEVFLKAFHRQADKGADAILALHVSEALSATINSARLAAREFTRLPVTVLDSGQLSLGLGFMVEKAARLAAQGVGLDSILAELEFMMPRTYVFAALDTLEYLRRSGRMNSAVARFGELVRLKPLLHMNQGNATAHRVRTSQRALGRLISWLGEYSPLERLAVLHAGVPARAAELRDQVAPFLPEGDIPLVQITPVLGAHLGVGALGFACVSSQAQ